jgi:hypothetical protein
VRGIPRTLIAAVAVLLLAAGLAACGGGSDSSSTASETEAAAKEQAEGGAGGGSSQAEAKNGGKTDAAKEGKSGGSQGGGGQSDSSDFVPKHHTDSGGGSAQFVKKGGDNSVQEFGDEADSSEFDAAATVLHNFYDARAAGAWDAACGYMTRSAIEGFEKITAQIKQLAGASCGEILAALVNPGAKQEMQAEAEQADARSLRFEGEQGFLLYTFEGTVYSMPMNAEDGTWKVARVSGSPLP